MAWIVPGVERDAKVGDHLHVRHRRVVIFDRAVHFFLEQNVEDAGRRVPARLSGRDRGDRDQRVAAIKIGELVRQADDYPWVPPRRSWISTNIGRVSDIYRRNAGRDPRARSPPRRSRLPWPRSFPTLPNLFGWYCDCEPAPNRDRKHQLAHLPALFTCFQFLRRRFNAQRDGSVPKPARLAGLGGRAHIAVIPV